jgi:hypothetical protein
MQEPIGSFLCADLARDVALAQNPANTGAFVTKPREAPVNCATTFGWWWKKNGSAWGAGC